MAVELPWVVWIGVALWVVAHAEAARPPLVAFNERIAFRIELTAASPVGEGSIREHAVAWHPVKRKYYLVADVVPLSSPHHPNTYETEIHLWSSPGLAVWTYHGVAVPKGVPERTYDGYGVASPAGMAYHDGKLYVAFSARKTAGFTHRGIGLAWSGKDPEKLPWTKTPKPVSDRPGEDDDAAVLTIPGDKRLHLYHRRTGPGGYRIAHTASATPEDPASWPAATDATRRPGNVRAQELTGAVHVGGFVHLFVIEHLIPGGMRIAHLRSRRPAGIFEPADPSQRYLTRQARGLAYSGHITPVARDGTFRAFFWTVHQAGKRYGLLGHPALTVPASR